MNMKVDLIESEEGPGYGAAILAGCRLRCVCIGRGSGRKTCESRKNGRTGSGTGTEIRREISEVPEVLSGAERLVLNRVMKFCKQRRLI